MVTREGGGSKNLIFAVTSFLTTFKTTSCNCSDRSFVMSCVIFIVDLFVSTLTLPLTLRRNIANRKLYEPEKNSDRDMIFTADGIMNVRFKKKEVKRLFRQGKILTFEFFSL